MLSMDERCGFLGLMLMLLALAIAPGGVASAVEPTANHPNAPAGSPKPAKPLFRDFLGLNTHTIQFKTDLYAPVTRLLRDYHGFEWDVGGDSDHVTTFPMARNGVNWQDVYGGWASAGYGTLVSLMFDDTPPDKWKDMPRDAHAYAKAFASYFGADGKQLVQAVEVGNEPAKYDDASYRVLLEHASRGFRDGDPKMLVLTANMTAGVGDEYSRTVDAIQGLEDAYDVINTHVYAQAEPWPTFRRTYPEDPAGKFAGRVSELIAWRDAHSPGKPIWVTEFGWDSSTKPPHAEGAFSKYDGVTDIQQARFLVRGSLLLAGMAVERAYLYWFNDDDDPGLHAGAGLTRHYTPKPSFHAVAHLLKTLGDYRFDRTLVDGHQTLWAMRFVRGDDPKDAVVVAWLGLGDDTAGEVDLDPGGKVTSAQRMPLEAGGGVAVETETLADGKVRVRVDGSPLYLGVSLP